MAQGQRVIVVDERRLVMRAELDDLFTGYFAFVVN
jgi:hypothetical protein